MAGVEIPPSWVSKIVISETAFKTRCPGGRKTTLYKGCKVERFSEYLNTDGLVTCVTVTDDNQLNKVTQVHDSSPNWISYDGNPNILYLGSSYKQLFCK